MAEGETPSFRVLVVDDSPEITALLTAWLSDLVIVDVAHDGVEALRLAAELKPHVLLVDIVLPGFSGFELVEMLRRRPGGLSAPVIFITGLQEPANAYRARELGAIAILYKPFASDYVRRLVTQLLFAPSA